VKTKEHEKSKSNMKTYFSHGFSVKTDLLFKSLTLFSKKIEVCQEFALNQQI